MIRQLSKSIREYKKPSVLTPIFVTLEVIIECIIPFLIARLINQINSGCSVAVIIQYGVIVLIMAAFSLLFGALSGAVCATASCGLAKNLRKDLFNNIQNFSFENIDRFSTSSLVTRLTTDVTNVQNAYMMIIRVAIRAPLMLIFAFTISLLMGGKLALIFTLLIPLLAFGLFMVIWKALPVFKKVFKKYDALNNSIQENVKAMKMVKSYARETYEKKKFSKAAADVCKDFTKAERILAFNNPMMQFCIYMVMIFVLSYGSYTIITSEGMALNVGQFSALLTYGFLILSSLMMLSMVFVMITIANESGQRIVEVLKEKSTVISPKNPIYKVKDGSIDFLNVSFKYADEAKHRVLADINLHIHSGETIGIIGATGSGKSSLIQLIPRLYDAAEGVVKVGNINVKDYDLNSLRNQVAVVLQKNILFTGTIKDNLRWGNPNATDEEMAQACKLAQAEEFILQFPKGYDSYVEQGGANLSGGQKQRLCIARALLKNPKILILDDSTSAVDTKTDAYIRNTMRTYIPHTTKIIIAQRTSSVQDADRIVVMENGKISAIGTHQELLHHNSIYRDIYLSQNKLEEDAYEKTI